MGKKIYKKVYQIDIKSEKVVDVYEDPKQAVSETGMNHIFHVLRGKIRHAGGYIFTYQKDYPIEKIRELRSNLNFIYKINLNQRKIVKVYDTAKDASADTLHCHYDMMQRAINDQEIISGHLYSKKELSKEQINELIDKKFPKEKRNRFAQTVYQIDIEKKKIIAEYSSQKQAIRETGITTLQWVLQGKQYTAGGFLWSTIELTEFRISEIIDEINQATSTLKFYQIDIKKEQVINRYDDINDVTENIPDICKTTLYKALDSPSLTHLGYAFTSYQPSEKQLKQICRRKRNSCGRTPVYQYDPKTGEFIEYFHSITEAKRRTGATNISNVVNGRIRTSGGYFWSEKNLSRNEVHQNLERFKKQKKNNRENIDHQLDRFRINKRYNTDEEKKIYQVDIGRKKIIAEYSSIDEIVKLTDIDLPKIKSHLKKDIKTVGGYYFTTKKPDQEKLESIFKEVFRL